MEHGRQQGEVACWPPEARRLRAGSSLSGWRAKQLTTFRTRVSFLSPLVIVSSSNFLLPPHSFLFSDFRVPLFPSFLALFSSHKAIRLPPVQPWPPARCQPGPWGVAKLVTSPPFPTRQAEDAQGGGVGKGPSHGPRSRVAAPPRPPSPPPRDAGRSLTDMQETRLLKSRVTDSPGLQQREEPE